MRAKILIADATDSHRMALKARLCPEYEVSEVATLGDLDRMLDATRPHVVIVDSELVPRGPMALGGLVSRIALLCERLRQYGAAVVMLAHGGTRLAALQAGAEDVLSKPVDAPYLLARLRAIVRQGMGTAMGHPLPLGMAEAGAAFHPRLAPRGRILTLALVTDGVSQGSIWQEALTRVFAAEQNTPKIKVVPPQNALYHKADLYLIAGHDDDASALALLRKLRAQPVRTRPRYVLAPTQRGLWPKALDLGADDLLPQDFAETEDRLCEAGIRLSRLLYGPSRTATAAMSPKPVTHYAITLSAMKDLTDDQRAMMAAEIIRRLRRFVPSAHDPRADGGRITFTMPHHAVGDPDGFRGYLQNVVLAEPVALADQDDLELVRPAALIDVFHDNRTSPLCPAPSQDDLIPQA